LALGHRELRVESLLKIHRRLAVVVLEHEVVEVEHLAELRREAVALEEVRDAHGPACHLVLVRGPDTAAGGADSIRATRALARLVKQDVRGQDQGTER